VIVLYDSEDRVIDDSIIEDYRGGLYFHDAELKGWNVVFLAADLIKHRGIPFMTFSKAMLSFAVNTYPQILDSIRFNKPSEWQVLESQCVVEQGYDGHQTSLEISFAAAPSIVAGAGPWLVYRVDEAIGLIGDYVYLTAFSGRDVLRSVKMNPQDMVRGSQYMLDLNLFPNNQIPEDINLTILLVGKPGYPWWQAWKDRDQRVLCAYGQSAITETTQWVPHVLQGLLAYWPFNEAGGTLAGDMSGNGYDGEVRNAEWTTGVCGTALQFYGKGDQPEPFETGSHVATQFKLLNVDDQIEFSLSAWFKTSSSFPQEIYSYYTGSPGDMIATLLRPSENQIHFNFRSPLDERNVIEVEPTVDLDDGNWHHIIFIRKSSSELEIYLDGVIQPKTVPYDVALSPYDNRANWFLGAVNDVYHDRLQDVFNGVLDEMMIFDHSLSPEEVDKLYQYPCEVEAP
jgi:hypothetical protein